MATETVVPTLSPSMDIQVSSNLERLLWEVLGGDGEAVAAFLGRFRDEGRITLEDARFGLLTEGFAAWRADDDATLATMRTVHERYGVLVDPHTAVGLSGVLDEQVPGPVVVLATAHPAKFPDAVEQATGVRPALPLALADLLERPERFETAPADLQAVERVVRHHARAAAR
jgi:threonine synthase